MTAQGSSKRLRVDGLRVEVGAPEPALKSEAARRLGIPEAAVLQVTPVRSSIDARGRPMQVYNADVDVEAGRVAESLPGGVRPAPEPPAPPRRFSPDTEERVVVIGAGPSGLFCADRLARSGVDTILVDRGQPVEVRGRDVSGLMHRGELKPDSNICFGEGGAGTWSDGKLYTRVKDERRRHVLETIVDLGGPQEILIKGKPHLGTDRLVKLCQAFRQRLTQADCQVRYGAFVEELVLQHKKGDTCIGGVRLRDGEVIDADRVILAVGHSAREMYRHLVELEVAMRPKAFAVGFRIEHRQALINEIQYGRYAGDESLPSAEYRLSANYEQGPTHRGVYSFCMCPGGQIVPSHTLPAGICVNGMSHANRRGHFANSALVVTVEPDDFDSFATMMHPEPTPEMLTGMAFQHEAERRAYELGGGGFVAPAQRVSDFVAGRASTTVRETTYKPGIAGADLRHCYPSFVIDALTRALRDFDDQLPGFISDDGLLVGVETRTSAPVQIARDDETYQSTSISGLYPCGEGAGYGGGIVSAAMDGLRIAERILEEVSQ